MPSASGGGGGQIDNPTHGAVVVGADGDAVVPGWLVLAVVVLTVVEVELEADGRGAGFAATRMPRSPAN
ncbi:hypothetical protein NIIDMKKI_24010 [Mycobacterium kansasii]|uniref:Uncharacterized protein n=1 Tax=Mycobacterium kansasii TaxID=1768 RepID=A0A7G1IBT9_MYCKA|nr:hypothetical protein NIIDMKKI_24010 [Mycobacterium kansasii]